MNDFIASCFGVALEILIIGGAAAIAFGPLARGSLDRGFVAKDYAL